MSHFMNSIENVDAAVFSGDSLFQEGNAKLFQEYLNRWQRALDEHVKMEEQMDQGCWPSEEQPDGTITPVDPKDMLTHTAGSAKV